MVLLHRDHCESYRALCEFLELLRTLVDLQDRTPMKVLNGNFTILMDLMC